MGSACRNTAKIGHIFRVKHVLSLVQCNFVLLFKYLAITPKQLVAFCIILAIVSHFIEKEKRQALDTTMEQPAFFLEMSTYGFANLYAGLVVGFHIARDVFYVHLHSISEYHLAQFRTV